MHKQLLNKAMRKIITPFMLLTVLCMSAATPKFLTVRSIGGSAVSYAISDIRKVTFGAEASGGLEIQRRSSSQTAKYAYESLDCLTFDEEQSGVSETFVTDNFLTVRYCRQSQAVEISASDNIGTVTVYSIGGNTVAVVKPDAETAVVDLSMVSSGVYIVKAVTATSSVTEKIVKR